MQLPAHIGLEHLQQLPFPLQVAWIDEHIQNEELWLPLLQTLQPFPDHEPLAYALRKCVQYNTWTLEEHEALVQLFLELPDTGIQRVLRGIEGDVLKGQNNAEIVASVLSSCLDQMKLERVAAMCLIDRWLKHAAPRHRAIRVERIHSEIKQVLQKDQISSISDAQLVFVSGARLHELNQCAEQSGCREEWDKRLTQFSTSMLSILQCSPRSLSQVHAEELLSRKVYTDPSHFLMELLQNAEDCKAEHFYVDIHSTEIHVWHDGVPFDARDVVGVLSIGQTTKSKEQIGFFGVGFKSVYEVCERPQVYSEWFSFEIADISIPRALNESFVASMQRVQDRPSKGTTLVLPFRPGLPDTHAAQELYRRACLLSPETLLSLRSIRTIRFTYEEQTRTIHRQDAQQKGCVLLEIPEQDIQKRYFVEKDTFLYTQEVRALGRAQQTEICVALALDEEGFPKPIEPTTSQMYSFLPTQERVGLPFVLQAHFDVPVDRERIQYDSAWNRWILEHVGTLISRAIEARLGQIFISDETTFFQRLLDLVPLREELFHPIFYSIPDVLQRVLHDTICLPSYSKGIQPRQARLFDSEKLAQALADVSLTQGEKGCAFIHGRRRKVAEMLGASELTVDDIVSLLHSALESESVGQVWKQKWLESALPLCLEKVYKEGTPAHQECLKKILLLPDTSGYLHPLSSLWRADTQLRSLCHSVQHFIHPSYDQEASIPVRKCIEKLGLKVWSAQHFVEALQLDDFRTRCIEHIGLKDMHSYFAEQPVQRVRQLAQMPLFFEQNRTLRILVGDPKEIVYLPPQDTLLRCFQAFQLDSIALLDQELLSFHSYLLNLGGQVATLGTLLDALEEVFQQKRPVVREQSLNALRLFGALENVWTQRHLERLAQLPIFFDVHGEARSLVGAESVVLPKESMEHFFPDFPWLDPDFRSLTWMHVLPIRSLDHHVVVESLLGKQESSFVQLDEAESIRRSYRYLLHVQDRLTKSEIDALSKAPIWLDETGRPTCIDALQYACDDPDLTQMYTFFDALSPIEEGECSAYSVLNALGLDAQLSRVTLESWLALLPYQDLSLLYDSELWKIFEKTLKRAVRRVAPSALEPLKMTAFLRSEEGTWHTLGSWYTKGSEGLFVCDVMWRPILQYGTRLLMSSEEQERWRPVLQALEIQMPQWGHVAQAILNDPKLQTDDMRHLIRRHIVQYKSHIEGEIRGREWLTQLPIWLSDGGSWLCPHQLIVSSMSEDALGPDVHTIVAKHNTDDCYILDESCREDAEALSELLSFRSPIQLLIQCIQTQSRPGEALSEQEHLLRSIENILQIQAVLHASTALDEWNSLPLAVSKDEYLTVDTRIGLAAEWIPLTEGLPVQHALAHPTWAEQTHLLESTLAPKLRPIRLLQELHQHSRSNQVPMAFAKQELRQLFYRWCMVHMDEWSERPDILHILGHLKCFPSRTGELSSAKELWLKPIEEHTEEWVSALGGVCISTSVPELLRSWLQKHFILESEFHEKWISIVLQAYRAALSEGRKESSLVLLDTLSETFLTQFKDASKQQLLLKRHKCGRIKVFLESGDAERISRVFMPSSSQREQLHRCMQQLPLCIDEMYDAYPNIRAFLVLCGGASVLPYAMLKKMLESTQEDPNGSDSTLSCAHYILQIIEEDPKLIHALKLNSLAWLPDLKGRLCMPRELIWPTPEVRALLGEDFVHQPHPACREQTSESIPNGLTFRTVDASSWSTVLSRLPGVSSEKLDTLLHWLEMHLRERSIPVDAVCEAFTQHALLLDSEGIARFPHEVVCESTEYWLGDAFACWPAGKKFSKLASILDISQSISISLIERYMREIGRQVFEKGGEHVLNARPELRVFLPRCLTFLIERDASDLPSVPVVAVHTDGLESICMTHEPHFVLPTPVHWFDALVRVQAPVQQLLITNELESIPKDVLFKWLENRGVASVGSMFVPQTHPASFEDDVTDSWKGLIPVVHMHLARMFEALSWELEGAISVRVVCQLYQAHTWMDAYVEEAVDVLWDTQTNGLWLTEGHMQDQEQWSSTWASCLKKSLVLSVEQEALLSRVSIRETQASLALKQRSEKISTHLKHASTDSLSRAESVPEQEQVSLPPKRQPESATQQKSQDSKKTKEETSTSQDSEKKSFWSRIKERFTKDESKSETSASSSEQSTQTASSLQKNVRREAKARHKEQHKDRSKPVPPPKQHDDWFRPASKVKTHQLHDHQRHLHDLKRKPEYGFVFSPSTLSTPHMYSHVQIYGRFERRTQSWKLVPFSMDWLKSEASGSFTVAVKGRLPRGENILPIPMFGQLSGQDVEKLKPYFNSNGSTCIRLKKPQELQYQVQLGRPPLFESEHTTAPIELQFLSPTVADSELPEEVLDFLSDMQKKNEPIWKKAVAVRSFVMQYYLYDAKYLVDPEEARALRFLTRGTSHIHIAALHARRSQDFLGAGVCNELGMLACELLRRLQIPASIASGWTWSNGVLNEPDHLWALALIPTSSGPRWMPIDPAAQSRSHSSLPERPRASWSASPPQQQRQTPPKPPKWSKPDKRLTRKRTYAPRKQNQVDTYAQNHSVPERRTKVSSTPRDKNRRSIPVHELIRVMRYLYRETPEQLPHPSQLHEHCMHVLQDPHRAKHLIDWLEVDSKKR